VRKGAGVWDDRCNLVSGDSGNGKGAERSGKRGSEIVISRRSR